MNSAITIPAEPTTISSPPRSPESSLAHQVGVTQPQETGTSYPARKLTADEFLPLAERNEAAKLELIHGEVVPMSPVNLEHSRIQSRLVRTLGTFVENHQLGEVFVDPGVILGEGSETVRAPDVAYWSAARLSQAPSLKGFTRVVPDLVVEVVSPHDSWSYLHQKVLEYLTAGVRLVWIADPETRSVTMWRPNLQGAILRTDDTLQGDDVLPGFASPVSRIFA